MITTILIADGRTYVETFASREDAAAWRLAVADQYGPLPIPHTCLVWLDELSEIAP